MVAWGMAGVGGSGRKRAAGAPPVSPGRGAPRPR